MELELSHVHVVLVLHAIRRIETEILIGGTHIDVGADVVGIRLAHVESLCERHETLPTALVIGCVGDVEVKRSGILIAAGDTVVLKVDFAQVCTLEVNLVVQDAHVHGLSCGVLCLCVGAEVVVNQVLALMADHHAVAGNLAGLGDQVVIAEGSLVSRACLGQISAQSVVDASTIDIQFVDLAHQVIDDGSIVLHCGEVVYLLLSLENLGVQLVTCFLHAFHSEVL